MAYLAPGRLGDDAAKKEWRLEGARRLARACELEGTNKNLPYHCIVAANLFSKAGERQAQIRVFERLVAVTDDEEILAMAYAQLNKLKSEDDAAVLKRRQRFFEAWRDDLQFVSLSVLTTLGPPTDAASCAGREQARRAECATSWRAWAEAEGTSD
jgi:hypothetical protein